MPSAVSVTGINYVVGRIPDVFARRKPRDGPLAVARSRLDRWMVE